MRRTPLAAAALVAGFALSAVGAPEPIEFAQAIDLPGPAQYMVSAVTDVTGDGENDVVLAGYYVANLRVFAGHGDGTFDAAQTFPLSRQWIAHVVVGKLNDDDVNDMVLSVLQERTIVVLLSDGEGGFSETVSVAPPDGYSYETESPALVDWDGDDDLDIVSFSPVMARVRLNGGGGAFGVAQDVSSAFENFPAYSVEPMDGLFADLDGDGDLDAYTNSRVYWREGVGTYSEGPFLALGPNAVAADFDGDGLLDLAGSGDSVAKVALHDAATSFSVTTYEGTGYWSLTAADLDGDARPELVGSVGLLVNAGDGTFGPALPLPSSGTFVRAATSVGDLDGDARPDVVAPWIGNATVTTTASVLPLRVGASPFLASVEPATLYLGGSREIVLTGTAFQDGCTLDLGDGVTVDSTTFESPTSVRARVTVAAAAAAGGRDARVVNPNGGSASASFAVAAGGVASVASVSPAREHAGTSVDLVVDGASFLDGASASFGEGVVVDSVEVLSADRLRIRATLDLSATPGARDLTIDNGSGIRTVATGAFEVLPPRSLDLTASQGRLRPSARPGRGSLRSSGLLAFNSLSPDGAFDPAAEPLQLRVGDAAAPLVVDVPADAGWRVRPGRATWTSPRRAPGPRVRVTLDFARGTFVVDVKRADLAAPASGDVLVELTLGDETGTSVRAWTPARGAWVLR